MGAVDRKERLLTGRFVLVVVVGLLYFLSLGTLLPTVPVFVERGLGGGSVAVGVVVGAFSVGAVLLRPYAGRIGDRARPAPHHRWCPDRRRGGGGLPPRHGAARARRRPRPGWCGRGRLLRRGRDHGHRPRARGSAG
ncbi:MAG: hypothetical protein R2726_14830 [Acidimicrobiales bacterium]